MKNPELITTVDLGHRYDNGIEAYQFVYASQLYGTLFDIFGQFQGAPTPDKSEFHLTYIKLYMVNYHGLLNIRFKSPMLYKDGDQIFFDIQGAGSEDDAGLNLMSSPLVIRKGERHILNFKRRLYPLRGIITAPAADLAALTKPIGTVPDSNELFDTEFYYRNGLDQYHNIRRPGMVGCDEKAYANKDQTVVRKELEILMPSGRCHESFVSLIYH